MYQQFTYGIQYFRQHFSPFSDIHQTTHLLFQNNLIIDIVLLIFDRIEI